MIRQHDQEMIQLASSLTDCSSSVFSEQQGPFDKLGSFSEAHGLCSGLFGVQQGSFSALFGVQHPSVSENKKKLVSLQALLNKNKSVCL